MATRKLTRLAANHPDDVVSSTSAQFGGFELVKEFYHVHPIFKSIPEVKPKSCYDMDSVLTTGVPRRERSKQRFQTEKKSAVQDAGNSEGSISKESSSECYIITHPLKHRNMRGKQQDDTRDSEVIFERPRCYGRRQSRRLCRSSSDGQKMGKLDSKNFEIYMEYVWGRFTEEKTNAFTYLDSLWFSLYMKGHHKEKVLSWIKKKDIFSKKYVFVPIVYWSHWFLLILCNFGEDPQSQTKGRCMLLLDSLKKANSEQLVPGIKRFVFDIFQTEERPEETELIRNIPLLIPEVSLLTYQTIVMIQSDNLLGWMNDFQVPQQKNGEECGFFVLYYINQFLENAPDKCSFPVGYPHFMKEDWFMPEDVERFVGTLDATNQTSDCSEISS